MTEPKEINGTQASASLRICSYTAEQIAEVMGEQGNRQRNKGDKLSKKSESTSRAKHSLWLRDSQLLADEPLEKHLEEIVAYAENHSAVLEKLRANCYIDIPCMCSAESGQAGLLCRLH